MASSKAGETSGSPPTNPPTSGGVTGGGDSGGGNGSGNNPYANSDFIPQSQAFNASLGEILGKTAVDLCSADAQARQANSNMIIAMMTTEDGKPRPPVDFISQVYMGNGKPPLETKVEVPLVSIVNTDSFLPDTATVTLDMTVSASSEDDAQAQASGGGSGEASVGYGPFKASVKVQASFSSSEQHKRSSDYRSTTHAELCMKRQPPPEGLSRIMDSMMRTVDVGLKIAEQEALDAAEKGAKDDKVNP